MQRISPGSVVSRIWEIYREQTLVLIGAALLLFGLEFIVILLIPSASIAIAILFWALSVLYQGMVVELVQDVEHGRLEHSVAGLLRSVEPVLLPLMAVSVLFAIGLTIGFVLLIIPGLILLVMWSVVAPVTVLERPGVFAAFGRSRALRSRQRLERLRSDRDRCAGGADHQRAGRRSDSVVRDRPARARAVGGGRRDRADQRAERLGDLFLVAQLTA